MTPLTTRTLDLSSNFLSGPLPDGACKPLSFDANCFTLPLGCTLVTQRQEAACNAFCGVAPAVGAAAACGGHGVCYPEGLAWHPHVCQNRSYSSSQPILLLASVLTKGTQQETRGSFTAAPMTLFVYEAGQAALGCGLELAFHANFTFSLSPQSGRVGSKGEDKSIAAVRSPFPLSNKKAYTAWVDYEPGDPGTIQVFLADSQEKPQQALLERRLALCEVLQGAAEQPAFFFGFVTSTTVKPFQQHVILESAVDTGKQCALLGG
ncbi:unnamed protein product [Closterium sp. NIES-65]|nr:unnamed protein product [Closterium sp. NIES-65]